MLLKNILKRRLEIVFGLWQMVFGVRLRKVSSTKEKDSALEIVFSVWQLISVSGGTCPSRLSRDLTCAPPAYRLTNNYVNSPSLLFA